MKMMKFRKKSCLYSLSACFDFLKSAEDKLLFSEKNLRQDNTLESSCFYQSIYNPSNLENRINARSSV